MSGSTVHSINVSMSATTEKFSAGLSSASGALKNFNATADKTAKEMGRLASQFQAGTIDQKQYAAGMERTQQDLAALGAGFNGHAAAVERTDQIMRAAETHTERYARAVRELTSLKRIGAMTEQQYARALAHTEITLGRTSLATTKASSMRSGAISMGRALAARAGMGGIGGAAVGMGAAATGGAAAVFVVGKLVKGLGDVEEKAAKIGVALDTNLTAASKRFNAEIRQLSRGWSQFVLGVENLAEPFASLVGKILAGTGKVIGAFGLAADAMARWISGAKAPEPILVQPVSLGERRRNTLNKGAAIAAAEMLEKQKQEAAELTASNRAAWEKVTTGWDDRAAELRKTLEVALTPMQEMLKSQKEIEQLWSVGRLNLTERNQLLQKAAALYKGIEASAVAEKMNTIKKAVAERLSGMTKSAQATLDAMLARGKTVATPTIAPLERGSQELFMALRADARGQSEQKQLLDTQKKALRFIQDMAKRGIVLQAAGLTG